MLIQFYHFQVPDIRTDYTETHQCTNSLLAIQPRSSRIYMQASQFVIHHHLQYMRMPADKQSGGRNKLSVLIPMRIQILHNATVIPAWIPSYVLNQYIYFLTHETLYQRELAAYDRRIYIAVDCPEWSNNCKPVCNIQRSHVTCVPYLIARTEILSVSLIPM